MCEHKLRFNWLPRTKPQDLKFDDDDQFTDIREQLISDLIQIKMAADVENHLNLYLRLNVTCKTLYKCSEPAYTRSHFQLDQVCKELAEKTRSVSILVRFASLTGNVTYLYSAINILLSEETSTLCGDELSCPAIDNSKDTLKIPYLIQKLSLHDDLKLPDNTVCYNAKINGVVVNDTSQTNNFIHYFLKDG